MLNNISRARLAGGWFAAVVVVLACSVVGGAAMTVSVGELWLIVCLVPPAVMLLTWPGAPAATVAELWYAVDSPIKEGRR